MLNELMHSAQWFLRLSTVSRVAYTVDRLSAHCTVELSVCYRPYHYIHTWCCQI